MCRQEAADPPLVLEGWEVVNVFVTCATHLPDLLRALRSRKELPRLIEWRVLVLGARDQEQGLANVGDRVNRTETLWIDADVRSDKLDEGRRYGVSQESKGTQP